MYLTDQEKSKLLKANNKYYIMEQGTRIIQLGSPIVQSDSITFEDAFGEFSEARGKGRARRKARKLERIASRDEVKRARSTTRQARRAEKQEGRIARRTSAQGLRQAKRTTASETRQARRTGRTIARQERKDLRNPEEEPLEESLDTPVDGEMVDTSSDQGYDTGSDQGYDQGSDQGGQDQGYDQGYDQGSQGYQGQETATGEEWGGQAPTGGWEGDSGQDYGSQDYGTEETEDTGDYNDDSGYLADYQSSDDFNFDGIMGAEDRYSDMSDSKSINVGPAVQDLANKIAWNQELINRLDEKRKNAQGNPQQVSKQILMRKKRLAELQKELDLYSNYDGDFSSADGKTKEVRSQEIGKAMYIANRERSRVNRGVRAGDRFNTRTRRGPINSVTPVQKSLKPKFSPNRIVVDAKSNATGLNGLDLMNDYDAPNVREIQLGADGTSTKSVNWKSIAIGVAIGVTAIIVAKKYNFIK